MKSDGIPEDVAVCPECGAMLYLMEDFDPDENEQPSLGCEDESEDGDDGHRFWQSDWQPVLDRVERHLRRKKTP